jgi:hypothetical protein
VCVLGSVFRLQVLCWPGCSELVSKGVVKALLDCLTKVAVSDDVLAEMYRVVSKRSVVVLPRSRSLHATRVDVVAVQTLNLPSTFCPRST